MIGGLFLFFDHRDSWRARGADHPLEPWLGRGGATARKKEKATVPPSNGMGELFESKMGSLLTPAKAPDTSLP